MKDKYRLSEQVIREALYPTWFRWKFISNTSVPVLFLLYIPHGSDESKSHLNTFLQYLRLYIPHGSDESFTYQEFMRLTNSFISHMVQMKATVTKT